MTTISAAAATYRKTAAATYRKTKQGEWVIFAPASLLACGEQIIVAKRDGTAKNEMISRVGRPFEVDGTAIAYGYIDKAPPASPASHSAGQRSSAGGRYLCDECGEWVTTGKGRCWETGMAH